MLTEISTRPAKEKIKTRIAPMFVVVAGFAIIGTGAFLATKISGPSATTSQTQSGFKTWYVDNTCPTAGNGTTMTCGANGPFRSIKTAFDNLNLAAGDTIKVRATGAPYIEALVTTSRAGTANSPITLTRYDTDIAKPIWTGTSGGRLRLDDPYYIIDRVEFDNAGLTTSWVVNVDAPNSTFTNCDMHNSISQGFSIQETGDNTTIDRCELFNIGGGGDKHIITTGRSPDPIAYTLTGLRITNNTIRDSGGDGIQLFEESGYCRQATVTGLIQGNIFQKGTRVGHENAMDIKTRSLANDPLVISKNTITGWDGSTTAEGNRAVVIQHCPDYVQFRNNFVRRDGPGNESLACNPCAGVVASASTATAGAPVLDLQIIGNTFVGMRDAIWIGVGTSNGVHRGLKVYNNTSYLVSRSMFFIEGPIVNGEIKNNLGHAGTILSCKTGNGLTNTVARSNGWFGTTAQQNSCSNSCIGDAGSDGDLCDVSDTKGADPLFMNPVADDFTLQPTSGAIDKGTDVGLSYSGVAPDLGAKEYISGSGGGSTCQDRNRNKRIDPGECTPYEIE